MSISEIKSGDGSGPCSPHRRLRTSIGRSLGLLYTVLWAPRMQMGLQTAAGIFFASLFIWMRDWTWSSACYVATLVSVGSLLVSQNTHLGGRLLAAAMLVGPSNVGYILGGMVASIAKPISSVATYTAVLCVLSSLGLLATTCVRAAKAAPVQGAGILLNLGFGIVMMRGQFTMPIDLFWREVVGRYMLNNLMAAGCLSLAGAMVVPSLAGSELQRSVAAIMRSVGDHVTACADEMQNEARLSSAYDGTDSKVCEQRLAKRLQEEEAMDWMWELEKATAPEPHHHHPYKLRATKSLARLSDALGGLARHSHPPHVLSPIPAGQQQEQVAMEAAAAKDGAPNGAAGAAKVAHQATKGVRDAAGAAADAAAATVQEKKKPSVASLRPRLQQAAALIPSAGHEPPFLQPQRLDLSQWQDVISALQVLITRVASLESALRGPDAVELSRRRIEWLFGNDTTAVLSGACGRVAGACDDLADAICAPNCWWSGNRRRCFGVFGPGWKGVRTELLRDTRQALETYRCRVRQLATDSGPVLMMPYGEMRAMMYLCSMSTGVVDSMDQLEQAVVIALVGRRRGTCPEAGGTRPESGGTCPGADKKQAAENGGSSSGGGGNTAPVPGVDDSGRLGTDGDGGSDAGSSSSSSGLGDGNGGDKPGGGSSGGGGSSLDDLEAGTGRGVTAARSTAHSARPPGSTWAKRWEPIRRRVAFQLGWLLGLAKVAVIPVDMLQFWWDLFTVRVPETLRSLLGKQKKIKATCTAPTTQRGGKNNPTSTAAMQHDGKRSATCTTTTQRGGKRNETCTTNRQRCEQKNATFTTTTTTNTNTNNNDSHFNGSKGEGEEKDRTNKRKEGNDGNSHVAKEGSSEPGQQQQGDGGGIDGGGTGACAVAATADAADAWRRLLSDRVLQYWAKTWLAFTVALCGVLALQTDPDIAKWNPFFAYVAAVIATDRKVETTLTKALLRVVGSWVGGTLGFVAMTNPNLANSPYGLAVLCCTVAFAMGLTGPGPHYKLAGMLVMTAFNAVVLCQYTGCPPCTTGEFQFYIAQVTSLSLGALLAVLINNLLLPWYASEEALSTLASVLREATSYSEAMYERFHSEGRLASMTMCAQAGQYCAHVDGEDSDGSRGGSGDWVKVSGAEEGAAAAAGQGGGAGGGGGGGTDGTSAAGGAGAGGGSTEGTATAAASGGGGAGRGAGAVERQRAGGLGEHDAGAERGHAIIVVEPSPPSSPRGGGDNGNGLVVNGERLGGVKRARTCAALPGTGEWAVEALARLQDRVAAPLAGVQALVQRDAPLWKRGFMAMPKVVTRTLKALLPVVDALAVLQLVLSYEPELTGHFTGATYRQLMAPMHSRWLEVLRAVRALSDCAAGLLTRPADPTACRDLSRLIAHLQETRARIRKDYLAARHRMHKALGSARPEHLDHLIHPDDTLRLLGFLNAWMHMINRLTAVCRVISREGCKTREGRWSWLR